MVFLPIKSLPNLLFAVCSASQEIWVTRLAQPSINPLACCICWAGLLGRAVFPPWNEGPNFGSYKITSELDTGVRQTTSSVTLERRFGAPEGFFCLTFLEFDIPPHFHLNVGGKARGTKAIPTSSRQVTEDTPWKVLGRTRRKCLMVGQGGRGIICL